MAKESYELINTNEDVYHEEDGLVRTSERKNVSCTMRIVTIFLIVIFCTTVTLVALKLSEAGAEEKQGGVGNTTETTIPNTISKSTTPVSTSTVTVTTAKPNIPLHTTTSPSITTITVEVTDTTEPLTSVVQKATTAMLNGSTILSAITTPRVTPSTTTPSITTTPKPSVSDSATTSPKIPELNNTTPKSTTPENVNPTVPQTSLLANTTQSIANTSVTVMPPTPTPATTTSAPSVNESSSASSITTPESLPSPSSVSASEPALATTPKTELQTTTPKSTTLEHVNPTVAQTSPAPTPAQITTTTTEQPKRKRRSIESSEPNKPVCTSLTCKTTASAMLNRMDTSVDPCDNFYEFACGGYKTGLSSVKDVWIRILSQVKVIDNSSPEVLQKYKTFYDSCVLHERQFDYQRRIAEVSKLVKEVGTLVTETNEADVDLAKLIAKLLLRRSFPVFDIDIGIKNKDSGFLLQLNVPSKTSILKETGSWLELSDDELRCIREQKTDLLANNIDLTKIYNAFVECKVKRPVYLSSIGNVIKSMELFTGDEASCDQQIQEIKTTIENGFLENLKNMTVSGEQRHKYEIKNVQQLQESFSFIQWKNLLQTVTGHTIDDAAEIQIYSVEYLTEVLKALGNIPKWKIYNALIAMHAQDLYENLVLPQAKHGREDFCVQLGGALLPDISSHILRKTWSDTALEQSGQFLTKIFNQLRTTLTVVIEGSTWADETTKTSVLSKLKNGVELLVNKKEDLFSDVTILQKKYENLVLNSSTFIKNTLTLLELSRKSLYDLQGKPYDVKNLWSHVVDAFNTKPKSFYTTGLIVAPIGVIRHPLNEEYPGYLTMAQLGLSIAKELSRQFDLVGIEQGITLSDTVKQSFTNFRNTMTTLLETIILKNQNITFETDPKLSLNERIVDSTAIRMITNAMHNLGDDSALPWISETYNTDKVFFIATAQEYCKNVEIPEIMEDVFESELLPPYLKVKNIMRNSETFSKVFECSEVSAMNNNTAKLQFPFM